MDSITIIPHDSITDLQNFNYTVIQLKDYIDRHFIITFDKKIQINQRDKQFITFKKGRQYFLTYIPPSVLNRTPQKDDPTIFLPNLIETEIKSLQTISFKLSLIIPNEKTLTSLLALNSQKEILHSISVLISPSRIQRRKEIKQDKNLITNIYETITGIKTKTTGSDAAQPLEHSSFQ